MAAKDIRLGTDARERMLRGIDILTDAPILPAEALPREFGTDPVRIPLQAIVFEATRR